MHIINSKCTAIRSSFIKHCLQEKAVEATTKQKEEERKKQKARGTGRQACHSVSTAPLQSVAETGTQSTRTGTKSTGSSFIVV
jgi:hypothetical protein